MAEPIGPMLKIRDKATALEVERLLEMSQRRIGPDQIDIPALCTALGPKLLAQQVTFFQNFVLGEVGGEATAIHINVDPRFDSYGLTIRNDSASDGACMRCDSSHADGYDIQGSNLSWHIYSNGRAYFAGLHLAATLETISSGIVTIDEAQSNIHVDTEGGAASDDLDTISGGGVYQLLIVHATNSAHHINVTEAGNILLGASPRVLDHVNDILVLFYDNSNKWAEVAFVDHAT